MYERFNKLLLVTNKDIYMERSVVKRSNLRRTNLRRLKALFNRDFIVLYAYVEKLMSDLFELCKASKTNDIIFSGELSTREEIENCNNFKIVTSYYKKLKMINTKYLD